MLNIKLSQVTLVRGIFSLAVILLVMMSFLLFKRMNRQVTFTEQAHRTTLVKLYLDELLAKVHSAEAGQRGFLLTRDSSYLKSFNESKQEINAHLATLDSLVIGHNSRQQVNILRSLVNRRMFLIDSVRLLYSNSALNVDRTDLKAALVPGKIVMEQIGEHTSRLAQTQMQLLNKEQKLKEQYRYVTPLFALLLITFAFVVFTLAYIILNRQLRISKIYLQQKHQAMEDLKEMNLIYQNAEVVATLGSWQWNLKTNMFKCSDNLFRIYGNEPRHEDISFNRFMSFVVPEDREQLIKGIERAIHEIDAVVVSYRIVRSDRQIRHMRAYGKMRADSNIMLGATQDVTEVTEAVEKLKSSESFNRSITELVPNIIYIYDLESRTMLYLNKDIRDLTGYSYQELTSPGFDFFQLVHPDDAALASKRHERFRKLKDRDVVVSEYRIKHKNGEWKYIYARTTCFKRDRKGAVTQIIGVASDVTDMKRTNEKLSAMNKELAQKNRELQQSNEDLSSFNFIASHDLQEPVRKIQTFASFLEESEPDLTESGRFYLQRMQHSASRIRALMQDLLTYAHVTSVGKEWSDVDLNVVMNHALQTLHQVIKEKEANIKVEPLPVVHGNAAQLQELFEHLLNNAFKYHKPGLAPEISITSETILHAQGRIADLEPDRAYFKISIADQGIGFEQEYAGKIFGLFQRLQTQDGDEGSGIGLAICKKIVQYHGGTIEAKSAPDQGAVFDIYLPA